MKNGYEVVIIGAGAAGCTLASNLKKGISALLIDQRLMPRKKACSGILVRAGKDLIKNWDIPKDVFTSPLELDLTYLDWDNNLVNKTKKSFYNSWRPKLDQWLFEQVQKTGVDIAIQTKVVDLFPSEKGEYWVILVETNGSVKSIVSKYVVGCDGALSFVRSKLLKESVPYYIAIQELIPTNGIKEAYFIFDNSITDFYSWVIPKGDFVEVGTTVKPPKAIEKFELFKKKVDEKFGVRGKGEILSAPVLRPTTMAHFFPGKGKVLLAGEAAGFISPSSAEGISYALRSGKMCAEAFNENMVSPLETYEKKLAPILKRLSAKLKKSAVLSDVKTRKTLFSHLH